MMMNSRTDRIQRFEFLLVERTDASTSSTTPESSSDNTVEPRRGSTEYEQDWRAQELRRLAQEGIPDKPPRIRPATYRQLLNMASPTSLSSQYSAFFAEVQSRISSLPSPEPHQPLGKYDKLLREIERDVERTFGTLAWFGTDRKTNDGSVEEEEDALWRRIRLLDSTDREMASELSRTARPTDTSTQEPAESTTSASTPATPAQLPALTLNVPSSLESTAVEVPPSPSTPTASTSQSPHLPPLQNGAPTSSRRPSTRRDRLLRPLFVYAFLNPGVSYVQGMSYLAAVFYYVFASDPTLSGDQVEATTFFALGSLISQLQDLYVPTLDGIAGGKSLTHGLGATLERFQSLLLWLDPTLADTLDRKHVELGGIILRWLTTVFANEFSLADLVRIWDRIISVYPRNDHQVETLSPILSHVLDLALAIVITNRATILSPYSNLSKIYAVLQSPPIEGSAVDKLLLLAWDIRERRLGRQASRTSTATPLNRMSSISRVGAGAGTGAFAGLRQKLWSSSSSSPWLPSQPNQFDSSPALSYRSSRRSLQSGSIGGVSGGEGQRGGREETDREGNLGSVAFSSPRSSTDSLANNVTTIEGKVLPPPPARIKEQETIAAIVEAELESPEYGVEDDEGEERASDISSLGGWFKNSVSRLAASDTAASLSKRATNLQLAAAQSASTTASRLQASDAAATLLKAQTNLAVQAQLFKDRVAAEQISNRMKEAGERLLASTGSERGHSEEYGPRETPFTPPTGSGIVRSPSPSFSPGGSSVPRPLLLSSSARRAHNGSIDEGSDSPLSSRRSSTTTPARSPSASPVLNRSTHLPLLSPDLSIPPLSRSPSRGSHGRSSSSFDTPIRAVSASSFRPRSASQSFASANATMSDDEVPITSSRLDNQTRRRQARLERATPLEGEQDTSSGEGGEIVEAWKLTDDPVRPSGAGSSDMETAEIGLTGLAIKLPLLTSNQQTRQDSRITTTAASPPPRSSSLRSEDPVPGPSPLYAIAPTETTFDAPNRPSELPFTPPTADRQDHTRTSTPVPIDTPFDISSDLPTQLPSSQPSLSRGAKVVRRPAATKKRSSRGSSLAGSVDFNSERVGASSEERRIASEFLQRSTSRKGLGENDSGMSARDCLGGLEGRSRDSVYDESSLFDSYSQ